MLKTSMFARKPRPRVHALPEGERIYAIGDIHGRRDCLDALLRAIDADDARRGKAATTLVFLGDLIDRGGQSRAVVERLMALETERSCVFVIGNHEEILISAWEGDTPSTRLLHRVGGRETLISYGVTEVDYDAADIDRVTRMVGEHVPAAHIGFLRKFRDSYRSGDYLFVHAGVKPGVAIEAQSPRDMRWIRNTFLDDDRDHGAMVVHGHSISAQVEERPNRIGIDTGAYGSGRLTAVGLEGTQRWFLSSAETQSARLPE